MQKHIELTRQRLQSFSQKLSGLFYPEHSPLQMQVYAAPDRVSYYEALQGIYLPVSVGAKLGPLWSTHWFKVQAAIPHQWQGLEVHLLWDSSSEACIWLDSSPVQGLTGSFSSWGDDSIRKEYVITPKATGGETFEAYIEVACNGLFGLDQQANNPRIGELQQAEIALFDRQAWELYWDLKVIADMALYLPANTPRGGQALYTANAMVNTILLNDRSTWSQARQLAADFFAAQNGDGQHNLSAVGHAHIDTAWLWPMAETRRKSARSFSSATQYMEMYPEYKYACSQAQQYEWMKEQYPGLYERIKDKVKSGQFIPVGGTWVEPDCNIPSGESLVRQFLFGQRFFQQEFGITCNEFWNPDVFGYSGALPQIMQLAGIQFFLTQKLSWNQFNKPASHTFLWEGIDGSRVLTHFPPADTYNSTASVKEMLYLVNNFKDHERANESLMLFGYGDGGGGPTPAMLEQLRRMKDVDGLPRAEIRSPKEFFTRAAADIKDPTVWVGELYFELHRGTYTTQARNKRFNRQSEFLLHDVEMISALAMLTNGMSYPVADLQMMWKKVLTNQFHDIIPGSSINEVYQDSTRDYEKIIRRGSDLRENALATLFPSGKQSDRIGVFNTLSFPHTEVIELPEGMSGTQSAASGRGLALVSAPGIGYAIQRVEDPDRSVSIVETRDNFQLENERLKAVINRQGELVSLFDKTNQCECIQPGERGNRFVLYEDQPNNWDAWDVDIFHLEKPLAIGDVVSIKIIESGPLRAALEVERVISASSHLRQVISLTAPSNRLDFECFVDWHEKQKFLKVEFPLNVRAQSATYEIQFGHVQRPTHFNTTYDLARFEVPAHRWADLSEPNFGVALLNDCKYGYATHDNIMRLSLLRASIAPDPHADEGQHQFRYALLPHAGNPQTAGVIEEAYRFNVPLLLFRTDAKENQKSFFNVSNPAMLLDTVKKAEDSDALILRLYESRGTRGSFHLTSSLPLRSATLVNLLEDKLADLNWSGDGIELEFKPFQIITLLLKM
ncbi:MAG TPA: alpha-mannosidase [Anaerolineales bacterium]|nr:alpha-mannosidase [Anaerolineales bacterium]